MSDGKNRKGPPVRNLFDGGVKARWFRHRKIPMNGKKDQIPQSNADGIPVFCSHTKIVDVSVLAPNPKNPNKHPASQIKLLSKIIKAQGWRNPIVVSMRSGLVVKGHGRLEAAKMIGVSRVPVDFQEYGSEEMETADMLADNRIAELADQDLKAIKDLIEELDTGDIDLELTGFDETEIERLMNQICGGVDAEPQIDQADELHKKWAVKSGQLWALGDHRLLCGDSTKSDDVGMCLEGIKPMLMVTDPPYGVEYDASWRNRAIMVRGEQRGKHSSRAIGLVTNDDRSDWSLAYKLFPGDVAYVWHPAGAKEGVFLSSLSSSGFDVRMTIVWAKNMFPIGRGHYHVQHEPCFYAVRKGSTAHWIGDRKQTTLWQIDKPQKSETGHSTQKPVECMARPIRNHESEYVYEPFSGSGTTIIACEQLGRKCRAIEIEPKYVAVSLQRFLDATGKKPTLA